MGARFAARNAILMKPTIVILSLSGLPVAQKIVAATGGAVHCLDASGTLLERVSDVAATFANAGAHIRALFAAGEPIVGVMAAGALIRILASSLEDKHSEPPVLAVADDESAVVPLLGGHHGANDLARVIGDALGVNAAVTTAGDVRFGVALDQPPVGFVLVNPENAKTVMAALIGGAKAKLTGDADWLQGSGIPFKDDGSIEIIVSEKIIEATAHQLHYAPQTLALGIGCERGADAAEAIGLAENLLKEGGFARQALAGVFSIDVKADEAAVQAVAKHFGVPARFLDAATLEAETPRLANPSEVVFAEVGCHGVSEGSALAAVGADGALVVPKRKTKRATAALALASAPFDVSAIGRARGKLFVVGIGPGSTVWRSPEASAMVSEATDLVAYGLYIDLLGSLADGKARHDFDLGAEEARVRFALELAGQGKTVGLICSGDAGIYAMATLVFELIDRGGLSDAAQRVEVQCTPGISALQGAAARAGAPLGHDFCTISLSDLLTPWPSIQMRLKAAAEGDFVIAFYNPVSKKRRTQLAYAREVLLEHRPFDTPVILATNLGRTGELVRVVPLGELDINDVDMLTVVVVGSSESRTMKTGDGKTWVYTPRGYAGKAGAGIAPANQEAAE
jgi:cobalt-precorrin 5A hydrolase / precorrin-3B C17-methyltransferase